ncbi:DUF2516 domain-containing protein [Actinomadura craniellae]|uniref:DUF2516 domain-containing protein n=1 Tax=Actinomadura craniellae TaxID=2231787 RepID=A0A365GX57_9ACTN|nr:DUF2516 family protein [Actinomadura craniellae]RAY11348.1 DUF2516 domain-containing protein [Actinomadura craniellae]
MVDGLVYFFWFLAIVAFVFEVWALIDALTVPAGAYAATDKQSKKLWSILLVVANVVGLGGAVGFLPLLSILPIAAFIIAAIYLADVRPAVKPYRKRGGPSSSSGPYGGW